MTEHNIEIPCNTEVLIRVSCKEVVTEPILVAEPFLTSDPVLEPIPEPIPVTDPIPASEPIDVIPETPALPSLPEPVPITPVIPTVPEPLPILPIPETPVNPTLPTPVVEPLPVVPTPPLVPVSEPAEHCYCDLDSPLSLADFVKQLTVLTKGLLYPSESDFPIDVLPKGFSSKMPNVKGITVRTLDRVIPTFLRTIDPNDQQSGSGERAKLAARWHALYDFIKRHASVTAWHYPVKQNKYTHELMVLLLHPQGTVALRIKLVET